MINRDDIERLFKAEYAKLYRLALTLLHDDNLARDVVHDVFASLLDGNATQASAGYLYSAVRNRCLNKLRDTDIHQRIINRYLLDIKDYDTEDWPDEETIAKIYAIISADLTEQCQRIMQLRFSDGISVSKIAAILGISENAVYKQLRHALVIIRKKLNQ